MKKLREIVEATKSLHPMALHVKPVMVNGQQKYKVHAVGKDLADGIKHGEHLSDSELDDAHEMGAKVKHVKESVNEGKMAELDHDLENMKDKDFETHYGEPKSAYRPAKKPMSEPKPAKVKEEVQIDELKASTVAKYQDKAFDKYMGGDDKRAKGLVRANKKQVGALGHVATTNEAESHQASTTMKHIPNPSPALKKAAKDIKPGIAGFRDRIAMLKAGNVKEDVEEAYNPNSVAAQHRRSVEASVEKHLKDKASGGDKAAQSRLDVIAKQKERMRNDFNRRMEEEADFGPEADKNITVQLKKAMDMMEHGEKSGSEIEFADGQKYFVEGVVAHKVLVAMEQMKPEIRAQAQNAVYQSFAHLMAAHQMLSK